MAGTKMKCFGLCIATLLIASFMVAYMVIYTHNLDIRKLVQMPALQLFNMTETHIYSTTTATTTTTSATTTITTASAYSRQDPPEINITWIDNHPIYQRFYIQNVPSKKRVTVLIVVSSAPQRLDRRNAIRNTWWKYCVSTGSVIPECIFITDFQGPNDAFFHQVQSESKKHGDMHMQLVEGGVTFGKRFIYHMLFAQIAYEYDYFIRVDDDQMFCLHRFLTELPMPPARRFHWGWVHDYRAIQRPEESMILLSKDLIETFLRQPADKMLCHPLADQQIAAWLSDLKITKVLRHDSRIHHGSPILANSPLMSATNLCNTYISIHGVYSELMEKMWSKRGELPRNITQDLIQMSTSITIDTPFNWQAFNWVWKYEPKRCITNPTWDTSKQMSKSKGWYVGRQEGLALPNLLLDYYYYFGTLNI